MTKRDQNKLVDKLKRVKDNLGAAKEIFEKIVTREKMKLSCLAASITAMIVKAPEEKKAKGFAAEQTKAQPSEKGYSWEMKMPSKMQARHLVNCVVMARAKAMKEKREGVPTIHLPSRCYVLHEHPITR
uniref:Uncharacterized protein n=1 Tax=Palpitomonas bilix TaxID=652834 RepID=A0A7S3DE88_9EUKA